MKPLSFFEKFMLVVLSVTILVGGCIVIGWAWRIHVPASSTDVPLPVMAMPQPAGISIYEAGEMGMDWGNWDELDECVDLHDSLFRKTPIWFIFDGQVVKTEDGYEVTVWLVLWGVTTPSGHEVGIDYQRDYLFYVDGELITSATFPNDPVVAEARNMLSAYYEAGGRAYSAHQFHVYYQSSEGGFEPVDGVCEPRN